jgi:UPF0271 protein
MIDLNCDIGEGFGAWGAGADAELMPLITSANIACGFHAGDPATIRRTIDLAKQHGVAVGAHPGYPDLQGFGRRAMDLSPPEIEDAVLYQIGAVYGFARGAGVPLAHVKPHGALYNRAVKDREVAEAIARAVHRFDAELILVGLAGSALVDAGRALGLPVAREAFADRAYAPDGSLQSRKLPGSVLADPERVLEQALGIIRDRRASTSAGSVVVAADTLCLHGDGPHALALAHALRAGLERAGVLLAPLREVLGRQTPV